MTGEYLVEVNVPEQLPNAIDRAFRTALTRRAPTAVIVPSDLQTEAYSPPEHAFKQVLPSAPGLAARMNGMAELLTITRYAERWSDRRCIVCVLHNNDLNQVTWELRAMGGTPKFEESQVLPDFSYAGFARSVGLEAITVTTPDELGPAWDQVLAADRPALLDVHCDPEVPPIPPHATTGRSSFRVSARISTSPRPQRSGSPRGT